MPFNIIYLKVSHNLHIQNVYTIFSFHYLSHRTNKTLDKNLLRKKNWQPKFYLIFAAQTNNYLLKEKM